MMGSGKFKAAVVGLGRVGMLFDDEPQRRESGEVWTHIAAYERLPAIYDLVAVVDPEESRRNRAKERLPGVRPFPSVEDMLAAEEVDVVSVCTPDATHLNVLEALAGRVRGVFLEKPLCGRGELLRAEALARVLEDQGTHVRVNYYKRDEPMFGELLRCVEGHRMIHVGARYSGPFDAVGSHALNLLLHFFDSAKLEWCRCINHEEGDGCSALLCEGPFPAQLLHCGTRHNLIFELEVITEEGRYVLEENLSCLRSYRYRKSSRYQGYRELVAERFQEAGPNTRRFVGPLRDIASDLRSGICDFSSMRQAMHTQRMMAAIREKAREFEALQ